MPDIVIKGLRGSSMPSGYLLGRMSSGTGAIEMLQIPQLVNQFGIPIGANPSAVAGPVAVNGSAKTYMRSDAAPAVQTATTGQLGLVKPDGSTITISGGTISAVGTSVPTGANPTATAGPVAVNGSASTFMRSDGAPAVQTATTGQLGLVKPDGTSITISGGTISAVEPTGANPSATASDVAVNGTSTNFMRADAAPAVQKGTSSAFGIVKVDGTTITSTGGTLSAVTGGGLGAPFHPGFASGKFYGPPNFAGTNQSSIATGLLYFTPFYVPFAWSGFTKAQVQCGTGISGTPHAEIGLYANVNGQPSGAPLYDFGQVALATLTNPTITGLTINLNAGWYWLAVSTDATANLFGVQNTNALNQFLTGIAPGAYMMTWSYSTGHLPTVSGLTNSTTVNSPTALLGS